MRFKGYLHEWDEQRGFGFIRPAEGGDDVFVHASALPLLRPLSHERLTFEVAPDRHGRKKAIHVRREADEAVALREDRARGRPQHAQPFALPLPAPKRAGRRRGFASRMAPVVGALVVVTVLARLGLRADGERHAEPVPQATTQRTRVPLASTASFTCDGRTRCSQMRSCEEATFFLRNCPGAQMDGNHDGVPCEQQWCTSGAR